MPLKIDTNSANFDNKSAARMEPTLFNILTLVILSSKKRCCCYFATSYFFASEFVSWPKDVLYKVPSFLLSLC
jgi:hypothetical protein